LQDKSRISCNLSKSLGYPSFAAAKINIPSQSLTSQQDELKRKGVSKEHPSSPLPGSVAFHA
jgi:hypothetical protein